MNNVPGKTIILIVCIYYIILGGYNTLAALLTIANFEDSFSQLLISFDSHANDAQIRTLFMTMLAFLFAWGLFRFVIGIIAIWNRKKVEWAKTLRILGIIDAVFAVVLLYMELNNASDTSLYPYIALAMALLFIYGAKKNIAAYKSESDVLKIHD